MSSTSSLETRHLQVSGMDCPSCAMKIEASLQKLTGVAEVSVSVATGQVVVSYNPQQIGLEQIGDRLLALGYTPRHSQSSTLGDDSVPDYRAHPKTDQETCRGHKSSTAHNHHSGKQDHYNHDHTDGSGCEQDCEHSHDGRGNHHQGHSHSSAELNLKRELPSVLAVGALFLLGIVFQRSLHQTPYHLGEYAVFIPAYLLSGWTVLKTAGRNILRGQVFDENFLMTVATLGAIAIHLLPEAVAVMLFYKIGELVQAIAVNRSRRSIQSLLEIRPDAATLKTETGVQVVSPESVRVGDLILVRPGEKIPLDGEVMEGQAQVDTSALTGESVPRSVRVGDSVLAGMINQSGVLTVRTTRLFGESSIARILELVENASHRKATPEKFITRFAQRYTPIVVFLSLAVAFLPPLLLPTATHQDWIYRALTLLVISCPCGLVISIPLGYFGGVGGAAKRGILVKGSTFLDTLAAVKVVVFDKTGTLTHGVFNVTQMVPAHGFSQAELLQWAAKAEYHSNHPIAQSIRHAYTGAIDASRIADYTEIPGYGIRATVDTVTVLAGNERLMQQEKIPYDSGMVQGTVVHVAVAGTYAGYLVIADQLKADAPEAIRSLKQLGVHHILMLTGDAKAVAARVARSLELDDYQAELLPEDKVTAIETVLEQTNSPHRVAFVGDGINDAPVIARADVGLAMGGLGSDAAIETADVVIMTDAPSKVGEAIQIGRKTHRIVMQNIAWAIGIKGLFILLGMVGVATLWEAVFADVGVALLAILNATRVLR